MAQPTAQPIVTPKERVAKALKKCSEQSAEFRIFPKELSQETYALLIFACSVGCPIERVAEDKFRVVSLTEKGKTFSIKEGDDFRRVFKLMVKAFLPSPDQRMQYLKRAEQYAEACLSAVDEMQESKGFLPLLSDILPASDAEAGSSQESSNAPDGAKKDDPKGQTPTTVSVGEQASQPTPDTENREAPCSEDMSAEQKIEAIQRMLGISPRTREEQEKREQTIIELQERVKALETQIARKDKEKEEADARTAKLRQEYDDYKLKVRTLVLD